MVSLNRAGKINVKVVVILLLIVVALGASLFVARHARRRILSRMDYNAGNAAYEKEDWPTAFKHFQEYLGRNPDDLEILKKYAEARMNMRPLDARAISGAASAYRRIIRVDPNDREAYEELAEIYTYTGQSEELKYIAEQRLEQDFPDERKAPLWLATALVRLDGAEEAKTELENYIAELEKVEEKPEEYVQACTLMGQIILSDDSVDTTSDRREQAEEALGLLKRAVEGVPDSAEALVARARFYRTNSDIPDMTREDRMAAARADLEAADKIGPEDPRIRSALCAEWIGHGELEKADAELQAVDDLPEEVIDEHFFDVNDWTSTRFVLASDLAMRRGDPNEAAELADKVLDDLTDRRHRVRVLDPAVVAYVSTGRAEDANDCLDEYIDATRTVGLNAQGRLRVAFLRALVARAQERPYAVIDILQPILVDNVSNPRLWRLLAEAYQRTSQPSRAIEAYEQYLSLNPDDSQATLQLADQYLKLKDWDKVYEYAKRTEELDPNDIVGRLLRIEAAVHLATEQEEAVDTARLKELSSELAGLREKYPERVDIRTLQSIIAVNVGQQVDAEEKLKQAIDKAEGRLKLRAEMQLARHYYGQERVEDAVSVCEKACARDPNVADPWALLATLHAADGDPNAARTTLDEGLDAVAGEGEKRTLSIQLARLELAQGGEEREKGIERLKDLAAKDNEDMQVRSLLLGTREILEDSDESQQLVDELREAEGETGYRWRFHQARLWLASDDWRSKQSEIVDNLEYCIDAEPGWSAPVLLLGRMHERLSELSRAEDVYRRALAKNPAAIQVADRLTGLLQAQNKLSDPNEVLNLVRASSEAKNALELRTALGSGDLELAIRRLEERISDGADNANELIALARLVYQKDGNFSEAQEHLKAAEAIDPNSMALATAKAAIFKADGKEQQARKVLDDYVADMNDFNAYLVRATYLAGEGEIEAAERDYKKLITFADRNAVGYGLLSNFYSANEDLDKAAKTLEDGLEAHPEDLNLQRALMKTLLRRGSEEDREQALSILGELEEKVPQDIELMRIRASQLLNEATPESKEKAKKKLEEIVKLEPRAINAHLTLIELAMERGDLEEARDLVIQALGSNPNNSALLLTRSRIEIEAGDVQLAGQLARVAIQTDPNSIAELGPAVNIALRSGDRNLLEETRGLIESRLNQNPADENLVLYRSHVLAELGRADAAIPDLEAYCESEDGSDSVPAIVTLAGLYRITGDMETAENRIEQAEQLDPNNPAVINAYMSLALAYYQEGNAESAKRIYQHLRDHYADKYPENIRMFNDLAWIVQEHDQDYDTALELANKGLNAARQDTEKLHVLDTRGTILFNMERFADAKKDFEALVSISPRDSERMAKALLQLGRTCAKLNQPDQAKEHLTKALEIDQKIGVFTPEERSEIDRLIK